MLSYRALQPEDDFQTVLDICLEAAHSYTKNPDEQALTEMLWTFFEDDPQRIFLMALDEENQEIAGIIACISTPNHFMYGNDFCIELVWYVRPEYRNTKAGFKLLKGYEQWAKNIGAKIVAVGCYEDSDRIPQIYEKMGYKLKERVYTKELN